MPSLAERWSRDALPLRKLADAPNFSKCFVDLRIETKETSASEGTGLSPQRLCGSAETTLSQSILRILRLNPKRDPLKPLRYVGMTGIPVDHRFENHRNGYKSAWVVRKYGVRLMPELFEHLNPMPFEAAVQMETELAEDLRAAGYTVTGGH